MYSFLYECFFEQFTIESFELMFRFDFLDQPANRDDPLSARDRTGGINIEMN